GAGPAAEAAPLDHASCEGRAAPDATTPGRRAEANPGTAAGQDATRRRLCVPGACAAAWRDRPCRPVERHELRGAWARPPSPDASARHYCVPQPLLDGAEAARWAISHCPVYDFSPSV
ncbi:unnamed protein product, partial [Urochloa humidicola]